MGAIAKMVNGGSNIIEPSNIQAVPITDDSGTTVMLRPEDVGLFVQGAGNVSKAEIAAFFVRCATWQVNPYKSEAYLIKYGSQPASIVIAEKVFEQRADRQPGYQGMEYGVIYTDKNGDEHKRPGKRINKSAGETLVGAYASVKRDGREPYYTEIGLDEYVQEHRDKSGRMVPNQNWATKPATMLTKCVKAAALRDAYPNAFSGMYVENEMQTEPVQVEATSEPVVEETEARVAKASQEAAEATASHEIPTLPIDSKATVTEDQQNTIMAMCKAVADATGKKSAELMTALLKSKAVSGAGYDGSGEMTEGQANACINVLYRWGAKAGIDFESGEVTNA